MTNQSIRFATFLAPNMFPVYQFMADYVGQKLGCPTELRVGSSFDQFAAASRSIGGGRRRQPSVLGCSAIVAARKTILYP